MSQHSRSRMVRALAFLTVVAASPITTHAQVPRLIRYQGQAVNAQGAPLEDSHALVFRLYEAETGGTIVWEETQANVPLTGGYFSVLLGQVKSLDAMDWAAKPLWLAVKVDADPELAPRQRITSVPLAIRAEVADRVGGSETISPQNLLKNGSFETWSKGTNVAPDGWTLEGGGGPIVVKNTTNVQLELSSATITNAPANPGYLKQTVLTISSTKNTHLRGATVTLSCWVKASAASLAQLIINEGPRLTRSAYHSGRGSYELLTVSATLQNDATELTVYLFIDGGASTTVTFDGAMLVEGSMPFAFSPHPTDLSPPRTLHIYKCPVLGSCTSPQAGVTTCVGQLTMSTSCTYLQGGRDPLGRDICNTQSASCDAIGYLIPEN